MFDPKQPPPTPDARTLQVFANRFSDESSLLDARSGGSLITPDCVRVGVSITARGKIASQLRGIEEHIIEHTQACLSRFGLISWAPDLRLTPSALYNSACRIIALDTFKQALVSHAYAHCSPNFSYVNNMVVLIKIYDHIIHHYFQKRYQKECRAPGSVRASDEANPLYRNRQQVGHCFCTSAF